MSYLKRDILLLEELVSFHEQNKLQLNLHLEEVVLFRIFNEKL